MALNKDLNFRLTDTTERLPIRINPDDPIAKVDAVTVPELLSTIAADYPHQPALKFRNVVTKDWETITYAEYKERVEKMAKVFIKLGLERHCSVAILAFNSAEWFISELAAIQAGYE